MAHADIKKCIVYEPQLEKEKKEKYLHGRSRVERKNLLFKLREPIALIVVVGIGIGIAFPIDADKNNSNNNISNNSNNNNSNNNNSNKYRTSIKSTCHRD